MTVQSWKTVLVFAFFLTTCLFATLHKAVAETETFQIQPQQQKTVSLNLNSEDKASGTVVVNGEGAVDFWISDPYNNNATTYTNIGQKQFSLTAETSGTFFIHIFNRGTSPVDVTLNYNVSRQIFGMPQETFLLLVIVGIILILIVFWAILSKA